MAGAWAGEDGAKRLAFNGLAVETAQLILLDDHVTKASSIDSILGASFWLSEIPKMMFLLPPQTACLLLSSVFRGFIKGFGAMMVVAKRSCRKLGKE